MTGLALLAVAVYLNALGNGFVYDDHFQIEANPWIRDFSHLREIFASPAWGFWGKGGNSYYRPLMHVAYAGVHSVSGTNPLGYHILNVSLHALNTILSFLLSFRLFRLAVGTADNPYPFALLAGAIFAVHPIHTEVVALVAAVPELLFTSFFLLGLIAWPFGNETGQGMGWHFRVWATAACFFLSLSSKETGLMLLPVVAALDLLLEPRRGNPLGMTRLRRFIPLLAVLLGYLAIRYRVFGGLVPNATSGGKWTPFSIVATAISLAGRYLVSLVAPIRLNFFHRVPPVTTVADLSFLAYAAVASGGAFLAIRSLLKDTLSASGWLLLAVPLVPVLYPPALATLFGEHNLYLPTLGFSILCARAATRDWRVNLAHRGRTVALAAIVLAILAVMTVARNPVYKDDETLWADVSRKAGNDAPIRFHRGIRLLEGGSLAEGIREIKAALALQPGYPDASYNIGIAYVRLGDDAAASPFLEQAVSENPGDIPSRAGLAALRYRQGRLAESLREYEALIRLDPRDEDFRRKAAIVRARKGGAP